MNQNRTCYESGPIRPPSEASSLLVRVSRNCPWNRCTFCTSYAGAEFSLRPVDSILQDIDTMEEIAQALTEEAVARYGSARMTGEVLDALRVRGIDPSSAYQVALFLSAGGRSAFLQDANSLVAPADDLVRILEHLKVRFPTIERVTTYARSLTLAQVGSETLSGFRKSGLTRVHVGMESGSTAVLKQIRKGMLPKHHILGGQAAMQAGLELSEYVMPGVGGRDLSAEHARESARVLNAINPTFIRLRSFFPLPGSRIADDIATGRITMLSEDEIVREIRELIEGLEGIGSTLVSDHDRNLLMDLEGQLPEDKADMLALIDRYLDLLEAERLVFRIGRRLGYFKILSDMADSRAYASAQQATTQLAERFGDAEEGLLQVMEIRM